MPLISVIVPVYNVEKYIRRCVKSIIDQKFKDFELILIDDGSPDSCGKICDEYAEIDNRIHVIHQKNGGLSAARNAGIDWVIESSCSEWITFVDSDDWVTNDYLERLYKAVQKYKTKVSVGRFKRVKSEEQTQIIEKEVVLISPEELWLTDRANATVAWGKLYHKTLFQEIRYPIGRINEDEFVTYKILFEFDKIALVLDELYMYFQNDESIMNSKWSLKRLDVLDAFEEQLAYFEEHKFKVVEEDTARIYINDMASSIEKVLLYYGSYQKVKMMRKKLKRAIFKYKKRLNFSNTINKRIFFIAYPRRMYIYSWILKKRASVIELYEKEGIQGVFYKIWRK